MKIAFDEHIAPVLVTVFRTLAEQGHVLKAEFVSARAFGGVPGEGDAPWMRRFADAGGQVVISGDKKLRGRLHEQLAYKEAGLVVFCFAPRWNQTRHLTRAAMLLHWWEKVEKYLQPPEAGRCWEIPFSWHWSALKDVTGSHSPSPPPATARE